MFWNAKEQVLNIQDTQINYITFGNGENITVRESTSDITMDVLGIKRADIFGVSQGA